MISIAAQTCPSTAQLNVLIINEFFISLFQPSSITYEICHHLKRFSPPKLLNIFLCHLIYSQIYFLPSNQFSHLQDYFPYDFGQDYSWTCLTGTRDPLIPLLSLHELIPYFFPFIHYSASILIQKLHFIQELFKLYIV